MVTSSASELLHKLEQDTNHQGAYGEAYVAALAAACGFSFGDSRPDRGTDLLVQGTKYSGFAEEPQLAFQIKCTTRKPLRNGALTYRLKQEHYNHLCRPFHRPKLLVIVHVPRSVNAWLDFRDDGMLLRHRAQWLSLRGKPNAVSGLTLVHAPVANRLTPTALRTLMQRADNGDKF